MRVALYPSISTQFHRANALHHSISVFGIKLYLVKNSRSIIGASLGKE